MSDGSVSLCAGLMARNESAVIERCVRSVVDVAGVTEFFLLDTGSEDDTVDVFSRVCAELGVAPLVRSAEWIDFGTGRTELLSFVRERSSCDWLLMVDADWTLEVESEADPFAVLGNTVNCDAYGLTIKDGSLEWPLPMITRVAFPWRYEGAVHEHLAGPVDGNVVPGVQRPGLAGVKAVHWNDGSNRAGRHVRDADMLQGKTDPRSMYYYAQSLSSSGQWDAAIEAYDRRAVVLGGWDEETYMARLNSARCAVHAGRESSEVLDRFLKAWDYRPSRLEAICGAAEVARGRGDWSLALMFASAAMDARGRGGDADALFVEQFRWRWGAEWEYWTALSMVDPDMRSACLRAWRTMLDKWGNDMPSGYLMATSKNIAWLENQGVVAGE